MWFINWIRTTRCIHVGSTMVNHRFLPECILVKPNSSDIRWSLVHDNKHNNAYLKRRSIFWFAATWSVLTYSKKDSFIAYIHKMRLLYRSGHLKYATYHFHPSNTIQQWCISW